MKTIGLILVLVLVVPVCAVTYSIQPIADLNVPVTPEPEFNVPTPLPTTDTIYHIQPVDDLNVPATPKPEVVYKIQPVTPEPTVTYYILPLTPEPEVEYHIQETETPEETIVPTTTQKKLVRIATTIPITTETIEPMETTELIETIVPENTLEITIVSESAVKEPGILEYIVGIIVGMFGGE